MYWGEDQMFRKFVVAVLTAVAEILQTAADALAAPRPLPAVDSPRLRLVVSGRLRPGAANHVTASVSGSRHLR